MNITIDKIQLRRGTAAAWTAANTILLEGEPGRETDTRKLKYGDGTTAWNSLTYDGAPGAWTNLTVPSPWVNASVPLSDPTIPAPALRLEAGACSVEAEGRTAIFPTDLISSLSSGVVAFPALIDAEFRPASKRTVIPTTATIIANFSPSYFPLTIQAEVNAAGDLTLGFGTLLPDAVTDLITYLTSLPAMGAAILVSFYGSYPITD